MLCSLVAILCGLYFAIAFTLAFTGHFDRQMSLWSVTLTLVILLVAVALKLWLYNIGKKAVQQGFVVG